MTKLVQTFLLQKGLIRPRHLKVFKTAFKSPSKGLLKTFKSPSKGRLKALNSPSKGFLKALKSPPKGH